MIDVSSINKETAFSTDPVYSATIRNRFDEMLSSSAAFHVL
jgi:hypothetical protein